MVKRARELRQMQTPAEELMWKLLRNRQFMGLKFRRQHQVGNYITDFYCHEEQLVLEIDGEAHDTPEARERDRERDAQLGALGFRVFRLKESVRAKMRSMVKRILRKHGYPPDKQEQATQTVLKQAEVLCDRWVA